MRKWLGVGLLLALGFWWWSGAKPVDKQRDGWQEISVGEARVWVEVRDSEQERRQGLSGKEKLQEDEGMLFVFESPAKYEFWMKEMKFDLDMVWIRGDEVVEISEAVPAPKEGEEPAVVKPKVAVDKVLEVNSGWVGTNGVKVGDLVKVADTNNTDDGDYQSR